MSGIFETFDQRLMFFSPRQIHLKAVSASALTSFFCSSLSPDSSGCYLASGFPRVQISE